MKSGNTVPSRKKGVVRYKVNPFLDDLTVPVRNKYTNAQGGTFVSDPNLKTGEISQVKTAQITHVEQVDKEKFVKVFTDEIKRFFDLRPSTQKMLQVILVELQKMPNTQLVYLDFNHAKEFFANEVQPNGKPVMTEPTFHRAIKELITKKFIAESTYINQYYINPQLFFSGDRLKIVKEYVIKKNKSEIQLDLDNL